MAEYICPHCRKPIYDDNAINCLYCGNQLNREAGFISGLRFNNIVFVIAAILIIIFILYLIF